MKTLSDSEYGQKELDQLKAAPWMIEMLKLNPEYCHWGPGEDYMSGVGSGWSGAVEIASSKEFNWRLDELNECVNFYFELKRDSAHCEICGHTGLNPQTRRISETFYDHDNPHHTSQRWCDKITQDELQALVDEKRIGWKYDPEQKKQVQVEVPPLDVVNRINSRFATTEDRRRWAGILDHDAINRWILIETRAKRLGVYGHCTNCEGRGFNYTEPGAHLELVLWMIHPRKGASRGVTVQRVEKEDLPRLLDFLREASKRNVERFSKVLAL